MVFGSGPERRLLPSVRQAWKYPAKHVWRHQRREGVQARPHPQEEMKIQLKEITIKQLSDGYSDKQESGVVGYGGKLDIRPPYQREFIYKDKQRDAVIDTVRKDFPLNVMYWAVQDDGTFEVIDGQQRTLSLCQYVNGDFSIKGLAFHNLKD